jgi:predicted small lipoprotein YifL
MNRMKRLLGGFPLLLMLVVVAACGSKGDRSVLVVDAEFDPDTPSDVSQPVQESNPGVAQSFTVLADGTFDEFWIVVTDGESADDGTIQITVRPVNAMGEPDPDPSTSIIVPIDVDTSTLPATLVDTFTVFSASDDPGRDVLAGEAYAIVVDFVSRETNTDTTAIARVLGQTGDP